MAELPLFNPEGKSIGTIHIDERIFGEKVHKLLLHQVTVMYEANRHLRTASTKTRSQVKGSTRKPWRQKHTGRARVGSIRSPIWRHGGVVFGPHPRDPHQHIPKRMRRKALDSALLGKVLDQEILVIERFDIDRPSTKRMVAILRNIGLNKSCLLGMSDYDTNLILSARNIPYLRLMHVKDFNAYDVLRHQRILLTRDSLSYLIARRGGMLEEPSIAST